MCASVLPSGYVWRWLKEDDVKGIRNADYLIIDHLNTLAITLRKAVTQLCSKTYKHRESKK